MNYPEKSSVTKIVSIICSVLAICLFFSLLPSKLKNNIFLYGFYFKSITNSLISQAGNYFSDVFSKKLTTFITELEKENIYLKARLAECLEYKKENQKLRQFFNMQTYHKKYSIAKVIYKNSGEWFSAITIDLGSTNGIRQGDIVFYDNCLIGKVIKIFLKQSIVLLTTDINFNTPVEFETNHEEQKRIAVVHGNNNGKLNIAMKHDTFDMNIGEKVYTTTDGGVFPAGLYVGQVTINNQIEPSFDIKNIQYVVVLTVSYDPIQDINVLTNTFSTSINWLQELYGRRF